MFHRLAAVLTLISAYVACPQALAGPNDVAIVIGNRDYQGNVPKVDFAERDAEAFAKAAQDVLGLKPTNIVPLRNLTNVGFRRWFGVEGGGSQLLSQLITDQDTTIYVFYSGHGLPAEIGGEALKVLLPSDADPQQASAEGFAIEWIRKAVSKTLAEKAPQGRAVLFLDACFSGSSAAGTLVSKSSAVSLLPSRISERASEKIVELAAAASDQVAYWDTERKHGAFTDALIDGLYGRAADTQGAVSADALARFVQGRLNERLARLYPSDRKQQTATLLGNGQVRLVTLAAQKPVRDPDAVAQEQAMCRLLSASTDLARIRGFLSSCWVCPCDAALKGRVGELQKGASVCRTEQTELERLLRAPSTARREIEAFVGVSECAEARETALRHLASSTPPPAPNAIPAVTAPPSQQPIAPSAPAKVAPQVLSGAVGTSELPMSATRPQQSSVAPTEPVRLVRSIKLPPKSGLGVAFTADGKQVATGICEGTYKQDQYVYCERSTIKLFDIATGKEVRKFNGGIGEASSISFSKDGSIGVFGSFGEGTVSLWNMRSGARTRVFNHGGWAYGELSPEEQTLVTRGHPDLKLWDAKTGARLHSLKDGGGSYQSASFSPDGSAFVSVSDKAVTLWDRATAKPVWTLTQTRGGQGTIAPGAPRPKDQNIMHVMFSPDGRHIAARSEDEALLIDRVDGSVVWRRALEQLRSRGAVAFVGDKYLATTNCLEDQKKRTSITFFGKQIESVSCEGSSIVVLSAADGAVVREFAAHVHHLGALAVSPDMRMIASTSSSISTEAPVLNVWALDLP